MGICLAVTRSDLATFLQSRRSQCGEVLMRWAPGYECEILTVCSYVIAPYTGRLSVPLSRAAPSALRNAIVLISCIGVFIMMWMIPSVCTATVAAAKTWILRQGWYGGVAPFLRDHPDSFRVVTMPWHSLRWKFPPELVSVHVAVG